MLTVARWHTPFDWNDLGDFVSPEDVTASSGDILLMRLAPVDDAAPDTASRIPHLVASIRRKHPGCPAVLWLPGAPPQVMIDAVRAARDRKSVV